jgi:hypothetical protein
MTPDNLPTPARARRHAAGRADPFPCHRDPAWRRPCGGFLPSRLNVMALILPPPGGPPAAAGIPGPLVWSFPVGGDPLGIGLHQARAKTGTGGVVMAERGRAERPGGDYTVAFVVPGPRSIGRTSGAWTESPDPAKGWVDSGSVAIE